MIKILKNICVFIIICMSFGFVAAAEEYDVKKEAYGLINSLNPIEEIINNDEVITRGEFIQAVVKLMSYNYSASEQLSFSDVDKEEQLYSVLSLAVTEKLINDAEFFRPEDEITMAEAMAICVRALGYEKLAQIKDSYPQNYINVATELDLFDYMTDDKLNAEKIYILFFNMLNAKVLPADYVMENKSYVINVKEQKTLLEKLYNVCKVRGVVKSNNYTAEGKESDSGHNSRITVGDMVLRGTGKYNDFLGYNVNAYYINEDEYELVFMQEYKNSVMTVASHDIAEVRKNGKKLQINIDDKSKDYFTESTFELIYNGKYTYSYTDEDLIPESGNITLIDNDDDGEYDVYCVEEYYYITDARTDLINQRLNDNNNSQNSVELSEHISYEICDYLSGEEIKLSGISDGDMFAVKKSKDGLLLGLYRITEEVGGEVSSYNKEQKTITVNGTEYNVSSYFVNTYTNGALFKGEMSFKKGVNGEIVSITGADERFEYGYLLRAYYDSGSEDCTVKIFTANGKTENYEPAEKLFVDGTKTDKSKISEVVSDYQLVRYMLNSSNKLIKLDLAEDNGEFTDSQYRDEDNSLTSYSNMGSSFYFRTATGCFYPSFNASAAVIFAVPEDKTRYDEYFIASMSVFSNTTYNVSPYDIKSDGSAGAIVYNYRKNVDLIYPDTNTPVIVVEKTLDAVNSDGELTKLMRGWKEGNFVEYYLAPGLVINKASGINELCKGDVIRAGIVNDELVSAVVEFDAHPDTFARNNVDDARGFNGNANGLQYQSGKVYSKGNGFLYITSTKDGTDYDYSFEKLRLFNVKAAKVIVVEDERGSLKPGSLDEIKTYRESGGDCDFVVLHQANLYTYTVIVYKGGIAK